MTTKQKRQEAIELYKRNRDILAVQRFLGHKTIKATLKIAKTESNKHNVYLQRNQ